MPEVSTSDSAVGSPETQGRSAGLIRTSSLVALANLISRVLGFAGDAVKSHYFGAGRLVDAFNVAAAVPTLLNDLLIQSLVNSAFLPVFSAYESTPETLGELATALLNLTTLFFAGATLLMELLAPALASILNGGTSADGQTLTANLLHVTLPALLALNFSGIASALLYAKQRIVLPAVAGAILNGTILLAVLLLQARFGIFSLAFGLLLGTLLQLAVQLYGLRGTGWRYRLIFWHPALRRIAALFSPILAGLLVEVFISRPVTFALASQTGAGGIAWMGYALTLRQLPEGLIATALSITILVKLSAVARERLDIFRETLADGLKLAFVLTLPASIGLFLLAQPVVALLFEHGSFTTLDTGIVAHALRWYLLGLPFSTIDLLLVVAFYARRNTLTPALIGLFTTFVYIGLSRALLPALGLYSLMLADSIRFVLHTVLSVFFLFRLIGGLPALGVYRTLGRSMLAAVVMSAGVYAVNRLLPSGETLWNKLLAVGIPVLIGVVLYLAMLTVLGVNGVVKKIR